MSHAARVFLSGFGAFEQFGVNPSGALVEHLLREPPAGLEVEGAVLPVSFGRSLDVLERALDNLSTGEPPRFLLGLGVHRGGEFRCEVRARHIFDAASRPDVDGLRAGGQRATAGVGLPDLWTSLEEVLRPFVARRSNWYLSSCAGGYVCEHVYRRLLEVGVERAIPALFMHVPPMESTPVREQVREVRDLLVEVCHGPLEA